MAIGFLFVSQFAAAGTKEPFKLIHVSDLNGMLKEKDAKVAIFDANTDDTRKKDGIIPGAKLLSSSKKYDTAKMLPSDKSTHLVFYCANEKCMASHAAADRAVHAGYKEVAVLSDGIQGWVKAGQSVEHP